MVPAGTALAGTGSTWSQACRGLVVDLSWVRRRIVVDLSWTCNNLAMGLPWTRRGLVAALRSTAGAAHVPILPRAKANGSKRAGSKTAGPKVFQRVFQSVPESVPDLGTILGTPPSINDYHSKRGVPGWNTSFFIKK